MGGHNLARSFYGNDGHVTKNVIPAKQGASRNPGILLEQKNYG
jgi:hypothetical protein